jgi:hypothetical protein
METDGSGGRGAGSCPRQMFALGLAGVIIGTVAGRLLGVAIRRFR